MRFRGDKRAQFPTGQRLGPDVHGVTHEVTTTTYDPATDYTTVRTRHLDTVDGMRIRYAGSRPPGAGTGASNPNV